VGLLAWLAFRFWGEGFRQSRFQEYLVFAAALLIHGSVFTAAWHLLRRRRGHVALSISFLFVGIVGPVILIGSVFTETQHWPVLIPFVLGMPVAISTFWNLSRDIDAMVRHELERGAWRSRWAALGMIGFMLFIGVTLFATVWWNQYQKHAYGQVDHEFEDPRVKIIVMGGGQQSIHSGSVMISEKRAVGITHTLHAYDRDGVEYFTHDFEVAAGVKTLVQTPAPSKTEPGWVQLFNGKDLTGWKTNTGKLDNWKVQENILIGTGNKAGLLMTQRADYQNFHFRVEAKINQAGDSGQNFRAQGVFWGPTATGYEAQISVGNTTGKTATLSRFHYKDWATLQKIDRAIVPADTWFVQEVIADGHHLTVKINRQTVATVEDSTYSRGHLALECRTERPNRRTPAECVASNVQPPRDQAGLSSRLLPYVRQWEDGGCHRRDRCPQLARPRSLGNSMCGARDSA
jgi:hypothetical protein